MSLLNSEIAETEAQADSLHHPSLPSSSKRWQCKYIEPAVLVLLFGLNLSGTVFKNQVIYQTCVVTFGFEESLCRLLGTGGQNEETKKIETIVQPYAADIFLTKTLIESVVPALGGLFIGPWSDKYGRKPLLIASFTGFSLIYIITCLISILSTKYVISPWFYISAVIPVSILGGNCVYTIATFCYIADITTVEQRPFRMAMLEGCIYAGLMAGSLTATLIFTAENAITVFAISAISITLSTVYIIIFIKESLNGDIRVEESDARNGQQLIELFNLGLLKDMFVTCFKRREHYDRAIMWLVIGTLAVSVFIIDGQGVVFYLFIREKFQWTVTDFTMYETVGIFVPIIGNVIGIFILRKIFDVSVISLALIAYGSTILNTVAKATASYPWHLYLGIGLGALKSIGLPMCRAILSNIVPKSDLGKLFSLTNVIESIAPFASAPLYTALYTWTLSSNPAIFNYFSVGLYFVGYLFLTIIFGIRHALPLVYTPTLK